MELLRTFLFIIHLHIYQSNNFVLFITNQIFKTAFHVYKLNVLFIRYLIWRFC